MELLLIGLLVIVWLGTIFMWGSFNVWMVSMFKLRMEDGRQRLLTGEQVDLVMNVGDALAMKEGDLVTFQVTSQRAHRVHRVIVAGTDIETEEMPGGFSFTQGILKLGDVLEVTQGQLVNVRVKSSSQLGVEYIPGEPIKLTNRYMKVVGLIFLIGSWLLILSGLFLSVWIFLSYLVSF